MTHPAGERANVILPAGSRTGAVSFRAVATIPRSRRRRAFGVALLVAVVAELAPWSGVRAEAEGADLVLDPDVAAWEDGKPVRWSVEVGASIGAGPSSVVERGPEGGMRLRGDASTREWKLVSQSVATVAGATYRMSFEARALDLRRASGQTMDNAYVGLRLPGAPGRPDLRVDPVRRAVWTPGEVVVKATGVSLDIVVFLSKSGSLDARGFRLEKLEPAGSLDALRRHMARYYGHFRLQDAAAWDAVVEAHRASFPPDGEPVAFVGAARTLLATLEDEHVWIRRPDGSILGTWAREVDRNYDLRAVARVLSSAQRIGKIALVGDLDGGIGYAAVASLQGTDEEFAALAKALDVQLWGQGQPLKDAPLVKRGLVVDLRANEGGEERRALDLVARWLGEPHLYAKRRLRSGPGFLDFGEPIEAWVRPRDGPRFVGPMVVLLGPECRSSGEGMAQMLKVRPRTVFVGQDSRGSSGSPAPIDLPNGISVWFSRWQNDFPDGVPLEGRGVTVDVRVDPKGTTTGADAAKEAADPTFLAGVESLRAELAK